MAYATPWGASQGKREIAAGIVFHHTAGHGGIRLSTDRQAKVAALFPDFKPFAGAPWYEEDCDINVVIVAFPESFTDQQVTGAVEAIEADDKTRGDQTRYHNDGYFPRSIVSYVRGNAEIQRRVTAFRQSVSDSWQVGAYGSTDKPGKWGVALTHRTTGQRARVTMDYPEKQFYTSAELLAIGSDFQILQ